MKYLHQIFILLLMLSAGCKKLPGDGGNSSIVGNVLVETRLVISNPNTAQDTLNAADEDVFIIYGDHISPDDKVVTNYDGEFEFRNLRPGDYTIYVYSKDTSGTGELLSNKMPIISKITISEKKEVKTIENIFIYDN